MADDLTVLQALERKVRWLSAWTIHHANHLRANDDGLKVGGHQASSASLATILSALYFSALRPEDRVAVKPHASPAYHAIQYLLGRQSRQKLQRFRALGGAQSYPSRTKDSDEVDFSTGSVGLGVAQTLFASLVQDYVRAHGWGDADPDGRMVALVGDAELDEGNIFEALQDGAKHGLRNTWWVVDYNRQSLDAVAHEGLLTRFSAIFEAFGWDVVVIKHGRLQLADGQHFLHAEGGMVHRAISPASILITQTGAGWRWWWWLRWWLRWGVQGRGAAGGAGGLNACCALAGLCTALHANANDTDGSPPSPPPYTAAVASALQAPGSSLALRLRRGSTTGRPTSCRRLTTLSGTPRSCCWPHRCGWVLAWE